MKNEFLSDFKKNHIKTLAESIKDNNKGEMDLSAIFQNNENLEYVAEANSALIGSFESIGKSNFIVGALANSKEGDIIGPLPTLRGQAFLKVIDIADVVVSDFEEKKDAIRFSLLIDRQNAIWGNWLQALRDNADLKDYRYDFYWSSLKTPSLSYLETLDSKKSLLKLFCNSLISLKIVSLRMSAVASKCLCAPPEGS